MKQIAKEMGMRIGDIFEHIYEIGDAVMTPGGAGRVVGCLNNMAGDLLYAVEVARSGAVVVHSESFVSPDVAGFIRFAINGVDAYSTKPGAVISHSDIRTMSGHPIREELTIAWHDPKNLDGGVLLPGESVTARAGLYFTVQARF